MTFRLLTSGQRVIFVECKSVEKLDQDYYYKLKTLSERYGIEPLAILASNQYRTNKFKDINKFQKMRGESLNVVTVSDLREIRNIGETIKSIVSSDSRD